MAKTLPKRMNFDESISDLSELICTAKLGAEIEGGGLSLIDNIKEAHKAVKSALAEAEEVVREKEEEVTEREQECTELEESLEDINRYPIHGIQRIVWKADNLLDVQVMEKFAELLEKHGSLPVLRALENINI